MDHVAACHDLGRCDYCGRASVLTEPVDAHWPFTDVRVYCDGAGELGTLVALVKLVGSSRCRLCECDASVR